MSWHYLPELVEGCSEVACADGEQSAPLKSTTTAGECFCNDSETACSNCFQSGMTCGRSTGDRGVDVWMRSLSETPANETATPSAMAHHLKASEGMLSELWPKFDQASSFGKTLPASVRMRLGRRIELPMSWSGLATPRYLSKSGRVVWELTMSGQGCLCSPGWPTPTANMWRSGKHTAKVRTYRNGNPRSRPLHEEWFWRTGERIHPNEVERLMGWPIGWTDIEPLATDKFQAWCAQYAAC
jgi:hypothetical protein